MQKNLKAYAHTAQQAIPLQDESRTEESRWTARRLTRTVPREYTHRAAVAEVFLTDWAPGQPDGFVVSAQWPRGHSFFLQRSGYQDPLLIAESVRQVGSLIAHAEFGVPLGHHFLMHNLSYTVTEQGLATAPIPTEVEMRVTCHDLSKRGGQLTGMRYQVTLVRDGRSVGFAEADFNCLSPGSTRGCADAGRRVWLRHGVRWSLRRRSVGCCRPTWCSSRRRRPLTAGSCTWTPGTPFSSTTPSTMFQAWC